MAFHSHEELLSMGFRDVQAGALVSTRASLYGVGRISLGAHCRIDDFCVLSAGEGGIRIGRNVHIAVMCSLIGQGRIVMEDFSGLSGRVSVYSSSEDYSGAWLTNPTVPDEFRSVDHRDVVIGRHSIIGAGSVILPGVTIGQGVAVGALSLVTRDLDDFSVYVGSPARRVGERRKDLLDVERQYLSSLQSGRESD